MRKHAPSFKALSAFESSARLGSFSRAAQELHLTPSAISHQISRLEELLAATLFTRQGVGVQLTGEGAAYLEKVQTALALIGGAADAVADAQSELRLHSVPSFAVLWLMPRLSGFITSHPEIKVRLTSSAIASDFARGEVDVEIRYGTPDWPRLHIESIFDERIGPLASPAFLAQHPVRRPRDLLGASLIASETTLISWSHWFAAHDVPVSPSQFVLRSDRSYLILEAAVAGLGVVLENDMLAERYLRSGQLVRLFDRSHAIAVSGHHVVSSPEKVETRRVATFLRWVRRQAALATDAGAA